MVFFVIIWQFSHFFGKIQKLPIGNEIYLPIRNNTVFWFYEKMFVICDEMILNLDNV